MTRRQTLIIFFSIYFQENVHATRREEKFSQAAPVGSSCGLCALVDSCSSPVFRLAFFSVFPLSSLLEFYVKQVRAHASHREVRVTLPSAFTLVDLLLRVSGVVCAFVCVLFGLIKHGGMLCGFTVCVLPLLSVLSIGCGCDAWFY